MNPAPLVLTMGDPAGIGPEIVARAFLQGAVPGGGLVVGSAAVMRRAAKRVAGGAELPVVPVGSVAEALRLPPRAVPVLEPGGLVAGLAELPQGRVDARCGAAAVHCVRKATEMALRGELDAICTAPLNKEALHAAGHRYPGHTELLAELTGTPEVSMLLIAPGLRVVHVTTHIGLIDA
ncbi:MAG TPA: 4-hydroxythreonine-4-phosphate dehydrogenase PdxA, partial [Methylibium sp.]|nr:4-hydroxythreonine-4-phosphate dehydrogenase PdxA [Methylibium sp.]